MIAAEIFAEHFAQSDLRRSVIEVFTADPASDCAAAALAETLLREGMQRSRACCAKRHRGFGTRWSLPCAYFAKESLFGDQTARARAILDRIIYAKIKDYAFEHEYRLAIPLGEEEEGYRTLAYHPEEVTELYLGSSITLEDKADILAKAKAVNPKIKVFQAKRAKSGEISIEAI